MRGDGWTEEYTEFLRVQPSCREAGEILGRLSKSLNALRGEALYGSDKPAADWGDDDIRRVAQSVTTTMQEFLQHLPNWQNTLRAGATADIENTLVGASVRFFEWSKSFCSRLPRCPELMPMNETLKQLLVHLSLSIASAQPLADDIQAEIMRWQSESQESTIHNLVSKLVESPSIEDAATLACMMAGDPKVSQATRSKFPDVFAKVIKFGLQTNAQSEKWPDFPKRMDSAASLLRSISDKQDAGQQTLVKLYSSIGDCQTMISEYNAMGDTITEETYEAFLPKSAAVLSEMKKQLAVPFESSNAANQGSARRSLNKWMGSSL